MNCQKSICVVVVMAVASLWLETTAQADITTGLIGHWKFDEGAGTVIGDSVGGKDGVYMEAGSPGPAANTVWVPGRIGPGAMRFNVTRGSQWINVPEAVTGEPPADIQLENTSYTVAWWARPLDFFPGGFSHMISTNDGTADFNGFGDAFVRDGTGALVLHVAHHEGAPNGHNVVFDWHPTLNQWDHWAVTYDKVTGILSAYLNGAPMSTGPFGPVDANPADTLAFAAIAVLGLPANAGQFFRGELDDIRFYNRALTQSDIAEVMAVPEPSCCILFALGLVAIATRVIKRS